MGDFMILVSLSLQFNARHALHLKEAVEGEAVLVLPQSFKSNNPCYFFDSATC